MYPTNFMEILAYIARFYHFQPSELYEFDVEDIKFWLKMAKRISRAENGKR